MQSGNATTNLCLMSRDGCLLRDSKNASTDLHRLLAEVHQASGGVEVGVNFTS